MSLVEPSIISWVRKQISAVYQDGGVSHFIVFHEGIDGLSRLHMERAPDPDSDEGEIDVAQILYDAAEKDASTRPNSGNPERYIITANVEIDDSMQEVGQTSFVLTRRGIQLSDTGHLPANEKGVIAQQLRQTSELHRMLIETHHAGSQRLVEENRRLASQVSASQDREIRVIQLAQDLMDKKEERDLRRAESERAAQRSEQMFQLLMTMVPILLAKFVGTGVGKLAAGSLPAMGNTARDRSVANLIKGLDSKTIEKIAEELTPEQQLAFFEIYSSYSKDLVAEEEAKPTKLQDPDVIPKGSRDDNPIH